MTYELSKAFYELLIATAAVTDICGSRIYATRAPQNTPVPYVVWTEVVSNPNQTLSNVNALDESVVQFSCYATDIKTAMLLRTEVRRALCPPPVDGEAQNPIPDVKITNPLSRSLPEEELNLNNAVLELTFRHHPLT